MRRSGSAGTRFHRDGHVDDGKNGGRGSGLSRLSPRRHRSVHGHRRVCPLSITTHRTRLTVWKENHGAPWCRCASWRASSRTRNSEKLYSAARRRRWKVLHIANLRLGNPTIVSFATVAAFNDVLISTRCRRRHPIPGPQDAAPTGLPISNSRVRRQLYFRLRLFAILDPCTTP